MPAARHDLCRAAQGHAAPHRLRRRSRDAGEVGQGHQGAGRLHGRHAAHDAERHLHRQRHRARHRLADAPLARRVLRSRQGQEPLVGQALVRRPHHSLSRLVARHRVRREGHRLCAHRPAPQDPRDVVVVRARPRRRRDSQDLLPQHHLHPPQRRLAHALRRRADEGHEGLRRHDRRRHRRGRDRGRPQADRAFGAPARREGPQGPARLGRRPLRPVHRRGPLQSADRRDLRRGWRRDHREVARPARPDGIHGAADPRHRPRQRRPLHPQHAESRQEHLARGLPVRHLPRHAPGRATDHRKRGSDVQLAVLRPRALRPLGGRPRQDEHAPRPRRARHAAHPAPGRHSRGGQGAGESARRPRRYRRHRPSRQPARAFGRRIDGESVSHRPFAHGARDQGAHVVGRDRHDHAAGPDQREAGGRGGARILRLLAAVAVHGPDEPALRDHPQAPPLGAGTGRAHARARRLRGARRASDPLWPHLPDRDAGRPEHRPHQLARDLCARQQVRLHREPVSPGARRQGDRRSRLSVGDGGAEIRGRAGRHPDRRQWPSRGRPDRLPSRRRCRIPAGRSRRLYGRLAEAARFRRRGADPVPRERRRQPRADGLEHAAPGGAAGALRRAARRHRHGVDRGARFRRGDRRAPGRRGRPDRRDPHRGARDRGDRRHQARRRHLPADEVPALQPVDLHQPEAAGEGRRPRRGRRHHRRRPLDRSRRSRARPQRARRLHAVERLQLRGFDPALRAHRQGRRLHLDPHRGIRGDGARHQARAGGNHPRHSQRLGRGAEESRRGGHRLYRRRGAGRRHFGRQDHAKGREPDDAGREASARHLRREGLRRARHVLARAAGRPGHGRRSARLQPPRRRQGRARPGDRARGDRAARQGPRRRAGDPRPQRLRASRGHPRRQAGAVGAEGLQEGPGADPRPARRAAALAMVELRARIRPDDVGGRGHAQAIRRVRRSRWRAASSTRSRSCSAATNCRPA